MPKEYDPNEIQHSLDHASLAELYDLLNCVMIELGGRLTGDPAALLDGDGLDVLANMCADVCPDFMGRLGEFSSQRYKHMEEE